LINELHNKVIWVTGALGLIGIASLEHFLKMGACVIGTDIRDAREHPIIQRLQETYGDKLVLRISDATYERQIKDDVDAMVSAFGRIDGLFHNSYTQIWKGILEMTLPEWEAVHAGTLTSTFLVNKYAVSAMIETGGGSIVNTSSILGVLPQKKTAIAYSAAKAAVNHMTRIIALEYAQYGLRANAIVPGDIKSPDRSQDTACNLTGRSGRPEEVAKLAAYLLSDASAYVTGSLYHIDGGFMMAGVAT